MPLQIIKSNTFLKINKKPHHGDEASLNALLGYSKKYTSTF